MCVGIVVVSKANALDRRTKEFHLYAIVCYIRHKHSNMTRIFARNRLLKSRILANKVRNIDKY